MSIRFFHEPRFFATSWSVVLVCAIGACGRIGYEDIDDNFDPSLGDRDAGPDGFSTTTGGGTGTSASTSTAVGSTVVTSGASGSASGPGGASSSSGSSAGGAAVTTGAGGLSGGLGGGGGAAGRPEDGGSSVGGAAGSAGRGGSAGGSGSAGGGAAGSGGAGGGSAGRGGSGGSAGTNATDGGNDAASTDASAGCPSAISLGASTQMPTRGNATGGTATLDRCPAGQVSVGYWLDPDIGNGLVGKLQALCGTISINQATCQIAIGAGATLPVRGMQSSNAPVTQRCAGNQMVVGLNARSGALIDQASFGCATLTLSKVGASYQASVGTITWLPPVGGNGGSASQDICPAGQISTGGLVRSGTWIDAFALLCATPLLVP